MVLKIFQKKYLMIWKMETGLNLWLGIYLKLKYKYRIKSIDWRKEKEVNIIMGWASSFLLCLWETRTLEWMGTPWSSSIMLVARLTPIHRYTYISFLGICSHNRFNNCSFYRFLDKNFSNSFAFFRVEKSMEIFEINLSNLIKFKLI